VDELDEWLVVGVVDAANRRELESGERSDVG
jgi:hypothetical protein